MLNPEQARSSIIAQQCWRRWAAFRAGDRSPCLHDDRAHQHEQANIDRHKQKQNKQQQQRRQRQAAHSSGAVIRHPDHHHPNAQPKYGKLLGVAGPRSELGLQYQHILANSGARVLRAIPRSRGPVEGDPGTRWVIYIPLAYWLTSYMGQAQSEHREMKTASKERRCRKVYILIARRGMKNSNQIHAGWPKWGLPFPIVKI